MKCLLFLLHLHSRKLFGLALQGDTRGSLPGVSYPSSSHTSIWPLSPWVSGKSLLFFVLSPVIQSQWAQHRGIAFVIWMPQVASCLEGRERKINTLALLRPPQCPSVLEGHSLCLSKPLSTPFPFSHMQLFPRWSLAGVNHRPRNTTE